MSSASAPPRSMPSTGGTSMRISPSTSQCECRSTARQVSPPSAAAGHASGIYCGDGDEASARKSSSMRPPSTVASKQVAVCSVMRISCARRFGVNWL